MKIILESIEGVQQRRISELDQPSPFGDKKATRLRRDGFWQSNEKSLRAMKCPSIRQGRQDHDGVRGGTEPGRPFWVIAAYADSTLDGKLDALEVLALDGLAA